MAAMTTLETLNRLIETCLDQAEGFMIVAGNVDDMQVRNIFKSLSELCFNHAVALQSTVARLGQRPPVAGRATGALRRGWMDLRSTLGHRDAERMLKLACSAENTMLHQYEHALETAELPAFVRAVLDEQCASVRRVVRRLTDIA